MKKISTLLMLFFTGLLSALAQNTNGVEMATGLRSSGKIYVVVLVIVVIFIGLAFYLFTIDRKINKLYKNKGDQM